MKTVRVEKATLREKILANRDRHQAIYQEAHRAWQEQVTAALTAAHRRLREVGEFSTAVFNDLPEPRCYVADYDAALTMLELHVEAQIVIDQEDFRQLVLDEWKWRRGWEATNVHYIQSIRE